MPVNNNILAIQIQATCLGIINPDATHRSYQDNLGNATNEKAVFPDSGIVLTNQQAQGPQQFVQNFRVIVQPGAQTLENIPVLRIARRQICLNQPNTSQTSIVGEMIKGNFSLPAAGCLATKPDGRQGHGVLPGVGQDGRP